MAIYAVIVSENVDFVRDRIKDRYDESDYHETPHGYFFIRDDSLTEEVSKKVGFHPDENEKEREITPIGIIFKYEIINGFYRKSLWEWLDNVEKAQS